MLMLRCKKCFFVLAACWAAAVTAEERYDLSRLEAMTIESNRALRASRDQIEAARYAVDAAAAFPNPEVEFRTGTARSRAPGGVAGDAHSTSLTQPLDLPWRRSARIELAQAGLASVTASVRTFEIETLAGLRLRYFEMLRRDAELKIAREDQRLMADVRARIALRVASGEAPRFELLKADAEALNAAKAAQAAAFRLDQARSLLRQAVGVSLPADFVLAGSLRDVPALPSGHGSQRRLHEDSAELARARSEVVRAERQLAYEKSQRWPGVALKAGIDSDPDMRTSQFGVVVAVPLWDRRSAQVGEAAAQLARARNEYEAQAFGLAQALEIASQQYEIAETQVTALESGIVRQAESALKVAESAYRFGERGFLEVLDAQRVYRAARAELVAARYELAAAWIEIERLRARAAEGK